MTKPSHTCLAANLRIGIYNGEMVYRLLGNGWSDRLIFGRLPWKLFPMKCCKNLPQLSLFSFYPGLRLSKLSWTSGPTDPAFDPRQLVGHSAIHSRCVWLQQIILSRNIQENIQDFQVNFKIMKPLSQTKCRLDCFTTKRLVLPL